MVTDTIDDAINAIRAPGVTEYIDVHMQNSSFGRWAQDRWSNASDEDPLYRQLVFARKQLEEIDRNHELMQAWDEDTLYHIVSALEKAVRGMFHMGMGIYGPLWLGKEMIKSGYEKVKITYESVFGSSK